MANPQEKRAQTPSSVASCSATDCKHNEDRACHAGEIRIEMGLQGATCATYSPSKLKARPESSGGFVSEEPERGVGRAMRLAVRVGDSEAAAVALEERARLRRAQGRRRGAIRDLCIAVLRFSDPVDRARAAHELTDVATTLGDVATAREALLVALTCGNGPQRDHALSRLYTLARSQGDQVGMRRWRSFSRPALVSITSSRTPGAPSPTAAVLARFREELEADGDPF